MKEIDYSKLTKTEKEMLKIAILNYQLDNGKLKPNEKTINRRTK